MWELVSDTMLVRHTEAVNDDWVFVYLENLGSKVTRIIFKEIDLSHEGAIVVVSDDVEKAIDDIRKTQISDSIIFCASEIGEESAVLVCADEECSRTLPAHDALCALFQTQGMRQRIQAFSAETIWRNTIIGDSSVMRDTVALASKIAGIDCDVLIQGETGTGKELIARLIHYQSTRQDCPFVPVNCGAFNDELLLSELFGHAKGAFTGATHNHVGLIEQAQGGTLFLDEIDSLSSKAQVALLRYLQDREIRPQGGSTLKVSDTRVLAASNADLKELVKKGRFREDLLFRLDVLGVDLPPLRERGNDVHLLAQYFIRQAVDEYKYPPKVFSSNLMRAMGRYKWPGNIRQLQNIVTRLFLLSDRFVIRMANASKLTGVNWSNYLAKHPQPLFECSMQSEKQRVIETFEINYLNEVLLRTKGNVSRAAAISKKERRSFIRLMEKYQIRRDDFIAH